MDPTAPMKTEPFTQKQVQHLINFLGLGAMLMDWKNLDHDIGRGILEGNSRCLWTTTGHRITISVARGGGVISSQSKQPDPLYAELKARQPV